MTPAEMPLVKEEAEKVNVSMGEVSEVKNVSQSDSVDAQKEILSRVINLNFELEKEKHISPVKDKQDSPVKNKPNLNFEPLKERPKYSNFQPLPNYQSRATVSKKKNNMILNMVFEIDSSTVKLCKEVRYFIRFRPYGERESVKIGPHFEQIITLMFPVG